MILCNKNKKNILILPSWYNDGFNSNRGIFFKEQALALSKHGHKVTVLAVSSYSLKDVFRYKKFPKHKITNTGKNFLEIIIRLPNIPKLKEINYFFRHILAVKQSKKVYKTMSKPDIIHVHSYKAGLSAVTLSREWGIPYIVTEHSSELSLTMSSVDRNAAKKVYKNAAAVIAVSSKLAKSIETMVDIKCEVIPNMINTELFTPAADKNRNDEFTFLNIGGLSKGKGGDLLIDSFANALAKSSLNLKLLIAGDGNLKENMMARVRQLNLSEKIVFKGIVSREEMPGLINAADALLLTSRYETFGIALIEAMACGLPVVSTRCGGPEDIIISDDPGVLTDINTESISDGILELVQNKDNFNKDLIRKSVTMRFSETSVIKELERVYFLM